MRKDIAAILEFDAIRDRVKDQARTVRGKALLDQLRFVPKAELATELGRLDEMIVYMERYGAFAIASSQDVSPYFEIAAKGAALTASEINDVGEDIRTVKRITAAFKTHQVQFLTLQSLFSKLVALDDLLKEIDRIIDRDLSIKDQASHELTRIRRKKKSLEQKITSEMDKLLSHYDPYLADKQAVIRNGHLVLPVLTQEKNRVEGIIHAMSDTGYTTFIEPTALVLLHNELYVLTIDEDQEIHRILTELTAKVLTKEADIVANNEMIGYIDFVSAKARYAIDTKSHVGHLSETPLIDLPKARHPLIDPTKVVANTFTLGPDGHIVVITGPNAGGKTVALKTIGLLVYMHQCGLAILTSKPATLSFFDNIYADIGDSQSLLDNLSTFAGHVSNLAKMAEAVTSNDLVLIDELGTGTDPEEGEALAVSLIRHFAEKKPFVVVSSHFAMLKQLGFTTKGIKNASMRFDETTLRPTYEFIPDIPGRSYGLLMARRYDMDAKIIAAAETIIKEKGTTAKQLLDELQQQLHAQQELRQTMEEEKRQLQDRQARLEKEYAKVAETTEAMRQEALKERQRIIYEAEKQAQDAISALANPALKLHEAIAIKHELGLEDEEPPEIIDEPLAMGDYAYIEALEVRGRVIGVTKKEATIVGDDGKTFKAKWNALKKIAPPVPKVEKKVAMIGKTIRAVGLELNLIGQRVDEALINLDQYMDGVISGNLKRVRIIHGLGTGALRRAVHEYLKAKPYVESFRLGESGEGGAGATVVSIK